MFEFLYRIFGNLSFKSVLRSRFVLGRLRALALDSAPAAGVKWQEEHFCLNFCYNPPRAERIFSLSDFHELFLRAPGVQIHWNF